MKDDAVFQISHPQNTNMETISHTGSHGASLCCKRRCRKCQKQPPAETQGCQDGPGTNRGMAHHFKKYMSMPRTSDCIVIQVRLVLSTAAVISFSPHQPGIISPYIAYVPPSKDIIYNIYTSCKRH